MTQTKLPRLVYERICAYKLQRQLKAHRRYWLVGKVRYLTSPIAYVNHRPAKNKRQFQDPWPDSSFWNPGMQQYFKQNAQNSSNWKKYATTCLNSSHKKPTRMVYGIHSLSSTRNAKLKETGRPINRHPVEINFLFALLILHTIAAAMASARYYNYLLS